MFSLTISLDSQVSITDNLSTALTWKEKNSLRTITLVGKKTYTQLQQINEIMEYFKSINQLEFLEELTIQINPIDNDQILEFVHTIGKQYENLLRIRRDFQLISFDNELLEHLWVWYNFQSISALLRQLVPVRRDNMLINLMLVASGFFRITRSGTRELWDVAKREFFLNLLESWFVDSWTLYTADNIDGELKQLLEEQEFDKTLVQEELTIIEESIEEFGYKKYSKHDYSRSWANSIALHYQHEEQIRIG